MMLLLWWHLLLLLVLWSSLVASMVHRVASYTWKHWWIRCEDAFDEVHHVLEVWLLAHVPAWQISNLDFVVLVEVWFGLDDCCVELLINVHLWGSEWESIYKDNLDPQIFIRCPNLSLEHQHVGWTRIAGELHWLDTRLERWKCHHKVNTLLHHELLILTEVNVYKPLV